MAETRILIINDHIFFGGGGDAVLRLERRTYEEAGYRVFTFSQSEDEVQGTADRDFVFRESRSRPVRKLGKFLYHPGVYRALVKVLDSVRPHLVRLHLISKYPVSIYDALEGYPVVQTLHGPNLFCATSWGCLKKNGADCEMGVGWKCAARGCVSYPALLLHWSLHRRLAPLAKKRVRLFLCPSKHLHQSCVSLGFTPAEHMPLAIDEELHNSAPAPHAGPPTILFVGVLEVVKGPHILLDAFRTIRRQVPDARLVYAGRGSLVPVLREKAARLGMQEAVQFLGFVEHSTMVRLYQQAHVAALPSIWKEQFGLVGPEALACGVPCVASRIGGIPEWLHDGEWGYLVPPRDPDALAHRICKLLQDRRLRLAFGERGRDFVRREYGTEQYKSNMLRLVRVHARSPEANCET